MFLGAAAVIAATLLGDVGGPVPKAVGAPLPAPPLSGPRLPAPAAPGAANGVEAPVRAAVGQRDPVSGAPGRQLGAALREQATAGGRMPLLDPELAALAADPTTHVDASGRVFVVDTDGPAPALLPLPPPTAPSPPPGSGPVTAQGVAPATGSIFTLHSRPGAPRILYIDFDGETVMGTAWNASTGIAVKTVPGYDLDGNPASFSSLEQQNIRNLWQEVAEDFAPFNIDVTTERPASNNAFISNFPGDPNIGSIAVITPDRWLCTSCGGIAYVDVFGWGSMYYQYAWIFPSATSSLVGWGAVVSHEVGHNLGLSHDGLGVPNTPGYSEYYGGTGTWGPLMGNPSATRTYTQWSRGEYPGASNTEDDLAKIAYWTGSAPDVSSSAANAPALNAAGGVTTADEVISSAADVDVYAVDATGGRLQVSISQSLRTNLVARVTVTSPGGATLADAIPFSWVPTLAGWTNEILAPADRTTGRYLITVRAAADPNSFFSSYGSLGFYNLTIVDQLVAPVVSLTATGDRALTASWPAVPGTGSVSYDVSLCVEGGSCSAATTVTATSAVTTAPVATGRVRASVTARDQAGRVSAAGLSGWTDVLSKPIPAEIQRLRLNNDFTGLSVTWGGGQEYPPVAVTGRTLTLTDRSSGATIVRTLTGASGTIDLVIPSTWLQHWADATITATTGSPAPWNTATGPVTSVFIGRLTAPAASVPPAATRQGASAAGSAPTTSRGPAPAA